MPMVCGVGSQEDGTGWRHPGDPISGTKWVHSCLRCLSKALGQDGYQVGRMTVRRLLKKQDQPLKANCEERTGPPHPDRDRQFRYIQQVKRLFLAAEQPVIGVDTKKKELIGNFKNPGRAWCRQAKEVNVHDFRHDALGRAAPYGIYDLRHNKGYVAVGTSAETSQSATGPYNHIITHYLSAVNPAYKITEYGAAIPTLILMACCSALLLSNRLPAECLGAGFWMELGLLCRAFTALLPAQQPLRRRVRIQFLSF